MDVSIQKPTRVRYGVMGYLCALAFVLYIDRICIGQAGTRMMEDLGLDESDWAWVGVAFQIAYGIFEPTTGHWGDKYGSRRVLIRIVLWWSAFTAITGGVWYFQWEVLPGIFFGSFTLLLIIRFLFGAGEAGALPNAARVISRWFPRGKRGPSQALISTCAQIGGATAPSLAAFLIFHIGWRWAFVIFGSLGVVWAYFFSRWFRDDPATHPDVNDAERAYILGPQAFAQAAVPLPTASESAENATDIQVSQASALRVFQTKSVTGTSAPNASPVSTPPPAAHAEPIPWRLVFANPNIWLLGAISFCTSFFSYMLFLWFPTYLKLGRGLSERESGLLGSLPYLFGASGVLLGGFVGDWLTARTGSRRLALGSMGTIGLLLAGTLVGSSMFADSSVIAVLLCSIGYFFSYIQLAGWWAAMGDVGGRHLGALFGLCNMMGLAGGAVSQLFLGYFAKYMKAAGYSGREQWDPAFYVYGSILMLGGFLWLFMNPRRTVVPADAEHV